MNGFSIITIISIQILAGHLKATAQLKEKSDNPVTSNKTFTLKVDKGMDPDMKALLDGEIIKEGENKFKILSSNYYLNFVVTKGQFDKCVLIAPKGASIATTDITYAKKKRDDPIVDGCYAAYIMCLARCSMKGDQGCPHCDVAFFNCRGFDMVVSGITLQ